MIGLVVVCVRCVGGGVQQQRRPPARPQPQRETLHNTTHQPCMYACMYRRNGEWSGCDCANSALVVIRFPIPSHRWLLAVSQVTSSSWVAGSRSLSSSAHRPRCVVSEPTQTLSKYLQLSFKFCLSVFVVLSSCSLFGLSLIHI